MCPGPELTQQKVSQGQGQVHMFFCKYYELMYEVNVFVVKCVQ